MTDELLARVRAAEAKLIRQEKATDAARDELAQALTDAIVGGVRPVDLEPLVRYKREHIRRITRARGAPRLKEPTVVSKRQAEDQGSR